MLITADVGGTKVDIAAFDDGGGEFRLVRRQTYQTKDYSGIIEVLDHFGICGTSALALGIAAPVRGRKVRLTNLDWVIDADLMAQRFSIPRVVLLNDLEAHAYGIVQDKNKSSVLLKTGLSQSGNIAVIAAGTGLGEAIIYYDGKSWKPFACEGGHTSFAPMNPLQLDLLNFVWQSHDHVSSERLISGSLGFPILLEFYWQRLTNNLFLQGEYNFSEQGQRDLALSELAQCAKSDDVGGVVSRAAEQGSRVCQLIMDLFVSMFAAEAANLALKANALGGVYLCGGISNKIKSRLQTELFAEAFHAKGRYRDYLKDIPVFLVGNEMNALLGLAAAASEQQ